METRLSFLKADLTIQLIILCGGLLCAFFPNGFIVSLIATIPFGAWQVFSAVFLIFNRFDRVRLIYLLIVVAYFGFVFPSPINVIGRYDAKSDENVYFYLLWVMPIILGVFYIVLTYQSKIEVAHETTVNVAVDDKILDI